MVPWKPQGVLLSLIIQTCNMCPAAGLCSSTNPINKYLLTNCYVPGTVEGSGDIRKSCNLCFQGAYSLKVETDMQTKFTIKYSKVLPSMEVFTKYNGNLEEGKRSSAWRNQGELHRGGSHWAETWPVIRRTLPGRQRERQAHRHRGPRGTWRIRLCRRS